MAEMVFLVGPRGSGKSTVARLLAERLGWDSVDADAVLEARAGRTIRDIFASEGEPGFRDRETAVLRDLCGLSRHVVATGGGVVLRPENRAAMAESGVIVYLSADAETLWRRISGDVTTAERRPALLGGGPEEVAQVLAAREALYRGCAGLVIDTAARTPGEAAEEIAAWLSDAPP